MNDDTPIMRVIPRNWFDFSASTPKSMAYAPRSDGAASSYNGDMISPKDALIHFTKGGDDSYVTVAVPAEAIMDAGIVIDEDGLRDSDIHDYHVNLLFSGFDTGNQKKSAKTVSLQARLVYDPLDE